MRIDHHAYQRGTSVALFGLAIQAAIGLTLLIFSQVFDDTAFLLASLYVLLGVPVWVSLAIVFHQHKLERLEALEEDELSQQSGPGTMFDAEHDEQRVAARRLGLMHKWLMPIVSLTISALLVIIGLLILGYFGNVAAGESQFHRSQHIGWAGAIALSFALISFIFSRFVAGMAKQEAWQNLRGGAGYMVGNALVLTAVAVGLIFRVFNNEEVIYYVSYAIPIYMMVVAAEIVLNFILNLYRPRIPGEVPRPAFDSRMLSLLSAPDSIVRSLNEAVNYQFGFDITSSWGYQLLLRSFVWLIALGVVVMVLLNCMVVVEPHQQAIKLQHGKRVGDVHGSGIMWKLPWPIQTAALYDVTEVRQLHLTARRTERHRQSAHFWHLDLSEAMLETLEPFIVSSPRLDELYDEDDLAEIGPIDELIPEDDPGEAIDVLEPLADEITADEDEAAQEVSRMLALVDAEVSVQYRIRQSDDGSGLLEHLNFVPETRTRRLDTTTRDNALRAIALREATQYLSTLSLDDVLTTERSNVASSLRSRIQRAFDAPNVRAGVEVISVTIPLIRPSGDVAGEYEELANSRQARRLRVARAERDLVTQLAMLVGDRETGRAILAELETWEELKDEHGFDSEEARAQRDIVEQMVMDARGVAALAIARAEADRWAELMDKRAQASRTQSQISAFRASPEIYREREVMRVISQNLAPMRKYVVGIDPRLINLDFELTELSPLVDFGPGMREEE